MKQPADGYKKAAAEVSAAAWDLPVFKPRRAARTLRKKKNGYYLAFSVRYSFRVFSFASRLFISFSTDDSEIPR